MCCSPCSDPIRKALRDFRALAEKLACPAELFTPDCSRQAGSGVQDQIESEVVLLSNSGSDHLDLKFSGLPGTFSPEMQEIWRSDNNNL